MWFDRVRSHYNGIRSNAAFTRIVLHNVSYGGIAQWRFMKYERFEDLPVWRTAMDLVCGIYSLTEDSAFARSGDLCSQIRRASLSISNNVAEGFERGTTAELLSFLYIARGSAGEVRSMLRFAERYEKFLNLKSQISNLISQSESCSRQIRGWADSLQNSSIEGQRRLTDKSRAEYQSKQRADEFLRRVDEAVRKNLVARPQSSLSHQEGQEF